MKEPVNTSRYVFGIILILIGLSQLFSHFFVGFLFLISAAFVYPATSAKIKSKLSRGWRIGISIGCVYLAFVILIAGYFLGKGEDRQKEKARKATEFAKLPKYKRDSILKTDSIVKAEKAQQRQIESEQEDLKSKEIYAKSHVESYLDNNLKDPSSYSSIGFSVLVARKDLKGASYSIRHQYRAKNSFGGLDIYDQVFYFDNEMKVIGYDDWSGQ